MLGLETLYSSTENHPDDITIDVHRRIAADPWLSTMQLDRLADDGNRQQGILDCNEVLAAVSREHIKAIVVTTASNNDAITPLLRIISGYVAGLTHLRHQPPIDLPLLNYHLTGPQKGTFTYLGRGQKELIEKATQAVREFQSLSPREKEQAEKMGWSGDANFTVVIPELAAEVKLLLGLDLMGDIPVTAVRGDREALSTVVASRNARET